MLTAPSVSTVTSPTTTPEALTFIAYMSEIVVSDFIGSFTTLESTTNEFGAVALIPLIVVIAPA